MKETKFTRCFVNGKKACVISWENGLNVLGCFGTWAKNLPGNCWAELVRMRDETKEIASTRGMQDAVKIPSADLAGIQAVIPGAVVDWAGSKEYETRAAAAVGTRGGSSSGAASGAATVPAVAAPDAFRVPELSACPVLLDLVGKMSPVVDSLNSWAAEYAAAMLAGTDAVAAPACIDQLGAFVPGIADAFKAYETIINNAVNDHREKLAAAEAARVAAEAAAAAAAAAAANGKNLITLSDGSTVEITGQTHPAFVEVLEDLKDNGAVYLYGPAGTGKSFMGRQLAEALGVGFESSGKADMKYDLIGTYDANGKHIYTAFTRAWCNGGVWLFDEMDRSADDACTAINDALANGAIDLPGLGMVKRHPDFYCLGAGNTCGFGASQKYSAARKQDFSFLTRFLSQIEIGYCRDMDMIVTGNDSELCDFAAAVRDAIAKTGIDIDLPIRALAPLQRKAKRTGHVRALACCLFAGVGTTQVKQIAARVKGSGAWFDALREYADKIA